MKFTCLVCSEPSEEGFSEIFPGPDAPGGDPTEPSLGSPLEDGCEEAALSQIIVVVDLGYLFKVMQVFLRVS